jgi:hypothetical protein
MGHLAVRKVTITTAVRTEAGAIGMWTFGRVRDHPTLRSADRENPAY